jgi:hypothetical protein
MKRHMENDRGGGNRGRKRKTEEGKKKGKVMPP